MNLALRSALSLAIQARDVLWTHGSLVTANVRDTGVEVLLGADGNELRADALPVFRLSTDGEASDGNILDQEWDLSRIEGGIAPILGNHRLGQGMEFGLGNWRNARIVDVERVLPDGKKMPGRELHAEADYDMADPVAAGVAGKVRRKYLRSTSVGWRPGFRVLRGDLPKDHRWYREAKTDDCGTRIEGYVMGRAGDPNLFVEGSMTPIPSDPGATEVDGGRVFHAARDLGALSRGERVSGVDLGAVLLAVRGRPGVREWARSVIRDELATPEGRTLLRSILAEAPVARELDAFLFARS